MALIKCPECGKEISDKAGKCPNCGCPIEAENSENVNPSSIPEPVSNVGTENKNRKKINPLIFVVAGVVVIAVVIIMVVVQGNTKKSKIYDDASALIEKGKYEQAIEKYESISGYKDADDIKSKVESYVEAIDYLAKGEYTEANSTLEGISDFADSSTIIEQIKWETRTFDCIKSLKQHLKNPDSLQLYEVAFYEPMDGDIGETLKKLAGDEPICVMNTGAQNGFGGNTTGYDLFIYSEGSYQYVSGCDSLNEDKVDKDDKETCLFINGIIDNSDLVGEIDIDRVKQILKDDNYTSIKIID